MGKRFLEVNAMTDKFILDVTAGYRMMWFDKQQPNTIYLDQRPECNPDIVGDFRNLKEFPDNHFQLIVWDPPHEIRCKASNPNCSFVHDFGFLVPETWQSDIRKGASECWRVLKYKGVLIFKWNDRNVKVDRVLKLFPIEPLFGQITKGAKGKTRSKTYWFCFMKLDGEAEK
jgi:hypothetical protein